MRRFGKRSSSTRMTKPFGPWQLYLNWTPTRKQPGLRRVCPRQREQRECHNFYGVALSSSAIRPAVRASRRRRSG